MWVLSLTGTTWGPWGRRILGRRQERLLRRLRRHSNNGREVGRAVGRGERGRCRRRRRRRRRGRRRCRRIIRRRRRRVLAPQDDGGVARSERPPRGQRRGRVVVRGIHTFGTFVSPVLPSRPGCRIYRVAPRARRALASEGLRACIYHVYLAVPRRRIRTRARARAKSAQQGESQSERCTFPLRHFRCIRERD